VQSRSAAARDANVGDLHMVAVAVGSGLAVTSTVTLTVTLGTRVCSRQRAGKRVKAR
jgi:hypothetical protein